MTAGELIARVDELRPNAYSAEQKLRWLRRLDGQILAEIWETHGASAARSAQSEALSSRTSPQAGVAIRSSDAETGTRIATPVTRSLVRNDSVGEGLAPPVGAGADPTTGGASPAPTETGETSETGNSAFRIPNSEFLRAHFDALWAASERLAAEFDDFDPEAALHDPDFLRLTAPGLGVEPRRAWLALHPESLQRRTADALRRSLASVAARPREGGRGGALPERDYRSLSRTEQQRLKERIHRAAALGEKIYP